MAPSQRTATTSTPYIAPKHHVVAGHVSATLDERLQTGREVREVDRRAGMLPTTATILATYSLTSTPRVPQIMWVRLPHFRQPMQPKILLPIGWMCSIETVLEPLYGRHRDRSKTVLTSLRALPLMAQPSRRSLLIHGSTMWVVPCARSHEGCGPTARRAPQSCTSVHCTTRPSPIRDDHRGSCRSQISPKRQPRSRTVSSTALF